MFYRQRLKVFFLVNILWKCTRAPSKHIGSTSFLCIYERFSKRNIRHNMSNVFLCLISLCIGTSIYIVLVKLTFNLQLWLIRYSNRNAMGINANYMKSIVTFENTSDVLWGMFFSSSSSSVITIKLLKRICHLCLMKYNVIMLSETFLSRNNLVPLLKDQRK